MGSVAVIGGGISGLTAAYRLKQHGLRVELFEAASQAGGVMRSESWEGYLAEHGPNSMQESSPLITRLIGELGLEAQQVRVNDAARRQYVVRSGRLLPLPSSPRAFVTSRLFSLSAKLRVLREPFIQAGDPGQEESVADFARRRLGAEVLDYVVCPFVTGVFAGSPEALSMRYALPRLYELEQRYGSLINAQFKQARERKRYAAGNPSGEPFPARFFSFRSGIQALPDALASHLQGTLRLNTPVRGLRPAASGWEVTVMEGDRLTAKKFEAVLYTAPLYQLPAMGLENSDELRTLADVRYSPLAILVMGFRRADISHPLDGLGMLVPEVEPFRILGSLFSSTTFPGRAPDGHVTLTTFVGGSRDPALAHVPTQTLLDIVMADLRRLLGVVGTPTFVKHVQWEKAIPQYDLGYGRLRSLMDMMESRHPGLFLAGNYRQGISVSDTMTSGFAAAEGIARMLGKS